MQLRNMFLACAAFCMAASAADIGGWSFDFDRDKITDKETVHITHLENGAAIVFMCAPLRFVYVSDPYLGSSGHYQTMLVRFDSDQPMDFEGIYTESPHAVLWHGSRASNALKRIETASRAVVRVFDYRGNPVETEFHFSPLTGAVIGEFRKKCPDAR